VAITLVERGHGFALITLPEALHDMNTVEGPLGLMAKEEVVG
jgi:hypothetical protein